MFAFIAIFFKTFAKSGFSSSGGLKIWRSVENEGGQILHKSNTFSDENIKR